MVKLFCGLFFTTILNMYIFAQDPVCRIINNRNGLLSNSVYDIAQDQNGFIWIAHERGLSRYDGSKIQHIHSDTPLGRSLSNIVIHNGAVFCKDFTGRIYSVSGDSLVRIPEIVGSDLFIRSGIFANNKLTLFDSDTLNLIELDPQMPNGLISTFPLGESITPAVFYGNDTIWALSGKNILKFDGKRIEKNPLAAGTPILFFLLKLQSGFWGLTKNEYPYFYQIGSTKRDSFGLPKGLFIQNAEIFPNEIWISTSAGAYCFNLDMSLKYPKPFFPKASVSRVFRGREGNYWFATINKGVYLVSKLALRIFPRAEKGLTSLWVDKNTNALYVGADDNEILKFNKDRGSFEYVSQMPINHQAGSLFTDTRGNVFIASDKLYETNTNGKIVSYNFGAKSIVQLGKDCYVMAHSSGAEIIRTKPDADDIPWLTALSPNPMHPSSLLEPNCRARWVCYDQADSILYISTIKGLYYFSPSGKGLINYKWQSVLAGQMCLVGSKLWVATYNQGIFLVERKKVVANYSTEQGLLYNAVYKVAADTKNVWMLVGTEIQRLQQSNGQIFSYLRSDGFPPTEYTDVALMGDDVFVSCSDGLLHFDKQLSTQNSTAPLISFGGIRVNGLQVHYTRGMELDATNDNIEVDFSVLSFCALPQEIRVEYNLNGKSPQELLAGLRTLSFNSLAPGKYTIEIMAYNEDGVPARMPLVLVLVIKHPFYLQTWFILLSIFVLAGFLYLMFLYRIKQINRQNVLHSEKLKLEQDLQRSMLASIKAQMNPHFFFNALNTIQSYIYTNDKENASIYLGKFSELTRLILEMSNKDLIPLSEEIRALRLYLELEKIRFEDKLQYTITCDPEISLDAIWVPSMLIQPYIENAIKHGLLHKRGDRLLSLRFVRKETGIVVQIDDNGIGRKRSGELNKLKRRQHSSFSSQANQTRLELLNKGHNKKLSLNIIDKYSDLGEALGTQVVMHIPFFHPEY
jgi:ligand-binding sensor domain-containing protein